MFRVSPTAVLVAALLLLSATPIFSRAHGPEPHSTGHKEMPTPHDEDAMKEQHQRMRAFKSSMRALLDAIIHGNHAHAQDQVKHLSEALSGREKDVPHKNISQVKEFRDLYGELNKRVARMAEDVKARDLSKTAVSYGRVLETCSNCHRKFRDRS